MKCLVTGASGFIGRELCRQLLARGHELAAFSGRGGSLPCGIATTALDLAQTDLEFPLPADVDVVFHLAGIAHQGADRAAYGALHVDATLRLARLARASGVRCFIYLSSVKAMGPPTGSAPRRESDGSIPVHPYGHSKWRAEQALRREFAGGDMPVIIIRPALVYGPGARGNLRRLANAARWGFPRPPAGGQRSYIALADLVELLCQIGERPPAAGQTWIACGDEAYSAREVYDMVRHGIGRSDGADWLPRWAWRLGAWLMDIGRRGRDESTWDKVFGSELYCNDAVAAALGWRPRCSMEDAARNAFGVERDLV